MARSITTIAKKAYWYSKYLPIMLAVALRIKPPQAKQIQLKTSKSLEPYLESLRSSATIMPSITVENTACEKL